MTAQFPWTETDYVSAQWARIKRHPVKLVAGLRYVISVFLIVVLAAIANAKWHALLVVCLIFVGMVLFALLIQRWRWHRSFRKTAFFRDEVTAAIDRHSVRFRGRATENACDWEGFREIYESSRVFLFERADSTFLFLPKKRMNQSQTDDLRKLIEANAKRKRRLSSHAA